MKRIYYILNNANVIGIVYQKENSNDKVVFMRDPNFNIEGGLRFVSGMGEDIEDDDVLKILKDFMFYPGKVW